MLKIQSRAVILSIFLHMMAENQRLTAEAIGIRDLSEMNLSDKPNSLMDPIVWDTSSLYKKQVGWRRNNNPGARSRHKRSAASLANDRMADVCQSKVEVITPYQATNSQGKIRKIVNSQLLQQAIQVETCSGLAASNSAPKCNAQMDCGCEQKYKWHRLLVSDPDGAGKSRGLFMDWFLFPSSCVCRCSLSHQSASKQFLKAIKRPDIS